MGKNNRDRIDRYEHQDFSKLISNKNGDNRPKKGNYNKSYQKKQKQDKPPVVVPEMAKFICNYFAKQVQAYADFIGSGDEDYDAKKNLEHTLFTASGYPAEMYAKTDDDTTETIQLYIMDRSVKFNREIHTLARGSMVAVALEDGIPAYYINCYLTKDLIGNISVVPLTEHGPDYRNSARWSNRPTERNDAPVAQDSVSE